MSFGFTITGNKLPGLPDQFRELEEQALAETAEAARTIAEAYAAKRTTSMAEALYTVVGDKSGYAAAVASAQAVNPKVRILPEVQTPGEGEAILADAAEHAIYNEFGTSRMPARPFMTPAALESEQIFASRSADKMSKLGT